MDHLNKAAKKKHWIVGELRTGNMSGNRPYGKQIYGKGKTRLRKGEGALANYLESMVRKRRVQVRVTKIMHRFPGTKQPQQRQTKKPKRGRQG